MSDRPTFDEQAAVSAGAGEESLTRSEIVAMAILVIVALAVRLYFVSSNQVISTDGTGYVGAARSLLQGDMTHLAKYGFYPVLIALANFFVQDIEMAGRAVSMVMGSLLLVPLFLLGREFFDRKTAVAACLVTLVWPSIRSWSNEVMSQATYLTLSLAGVWLVWRTFRTGARATAFTAGIFLGLAYVTRTEAFLLAVAVPLVPLAAALLEPSRRRSAVRLLAPYLAGFLLVLLVNLFLIHAVSGRWQLAYKTSEALRDSLVRYLGVAEFEITPEMNKVGYLDLIRDYPGFIAHTTWENLKLTWETMVPSFVWPLVFIGFLAGGWNRGENAKRLFLLSTFSPLAVIIAFYYVGPEYLQPYLPVMFLWGAWGLGTLERLATGCTLLPRPVRRTLAALPLALSIALVFSLLTLASQIPTGPEKPYDYADDGGRFDQKRLGLALRDYLPPGKIMTRWPRVAYYSGREWAGVPNEDLPGVIAAARKEGVRFLVVDGALVDFRPQLGPLLAPFDKENEGRDLFQVREPGEISYMPFPGVCLYLILLHPSSAGMAVYEISPAEVGK